ncbi:MAG: hypothetical protein HY746_09500 [Elusimicrobia bacterium]|nr:hypothetical protein [Elusimicrobiota bacterium]
MENKEQVFSEIDYLWDAMGEAQKKAENLNLRHLENRKELEKLTGRISHLENILYEKTSLEKILREEITGLKETINRDKKLVEEARNALTGLLESRKEIAALKTDLCEKEKSEELLKLKIAELESKVREAANILAKKEETVRELSLKIKGIFSLPEIKTALEACGGKPDITADMALKLEKSKLETEEAQNKICGIRDETVRLRKNLEAAEELNLRLREETAHAGEAAQKHEQSLKELIQKNEAEDARFRRAEVELEAIKKNAMQTAELGTELTRKNEKLAAVLKEKEEEIHQLTLSVKDKNLKIEEQKQNFVDAVKKIFSMQTQIKDLRENAGESRERERELEDALKEKILDNEKLHALLKESYLKFNQEKEISLRARDKVSMLESDMKEIKTGFAKEQQCVRELLKKNKEKEETVEALKKELGKIEKLESEVEQIRKKNALISALIRQQHREFADRIINPIEKISKELKALGMRMHPELSRALGISAKKLLDTLSAVKTWQDYIDEEPLDMESFQIKDVVEDILGQWIKTMQSRKITLLRRIAPGIPKCRFNAEKLKFAMNQIIKNSTEAMPAGGIFTATVSFSPENNTVHIKFEDTGPGIPQSILEKLFMPFNTSKKNRVGLGIPIAKKIAAKHGGDFAVGNKERGVTAEFTLPI